MEDNKQQILAPLFGIFPMSKGARILHASIISLIGSSFFAYTIWTKMGTNSSSSDIMRTISGWHLLPCYIISVVIFISAFPLIGRKHVLVQQILRMIMILMWFMLYTQMSKILLILFYQYLPA